MSSNTLAVALIVIFCVSIVAPRICTHDQTCGCSITDPATKELLYFFYLKHFTPVKPDPPTKNTSGPSPNEQVIDVFKLEEEKEEEEEEEEEEVDVEVESTPDVDFSMKPDAEYAVPFIIEGVFGVSFFISDQGKTQRLECFLGDRSSQRMIDVRLYKSDQGKEAMI
ncbi:hypothetical protein E3N88_00714 [Mikania micrantha]|uniref:Uncharacterized protein n=1 Tax=Mikania micrantha TaxID=192012 RepID=A0A5N6Q177_9ASTR|nr:hypothetical protein E3N88_00714 [Mikania micrantha]